MSTALLLWGVLFGAIGLGYFMYGKKQAAIMPMVCGLCLMLLPMVVYNSYLLVGLSGVLVAAPWYWRV
ncbi:MAG: hypothetical protein KDI71_16560 [Xanthomonadales bacterium]|nr:hypothetical protein [Xanthomonadales bacterium]